MTPGFHFHSPAPIGLHTHSGPDVLHRSLCKGLFFFIFIYIIIIIIIIIGYNTRRSVLSVRYA